MNSLIEKGYVQKMSCGGNVAYVLNDSGLFLPTEYKVLQNQTDSCFVKCMRMTHNGKIQLYYMTQGLKSFGSMLPSLDADGFLIVASNIISDIIDVKHNGFLSCEKIDMSLEHIYVDPATLKVSLVYLPFGVGVYDDYAVFENEIRTELIKMISGIGKFSSPKTMQLAADLANGTLKLEDVLNNIKKEKAPQKEQKTIARPQPQPQQQTVVQPKEVKKALRIIAMNAPSKFELLMTKDDFVIGRNSAMADGVISFNKMIGRAHCKITRAGEQFTIIDLKSSNGTFVNSARLQPHCPHVIHHGDIIRLANSDFQVSIM